MKKTALLLIWICIIVSCKNDDENGTDSPSQNKVLLLKIDFETYTFEEGKELIFETDKDFEISSNYLFAGDFGGITLLYDGIEEKIFSGSIIWNGTGEIDFPQNFTKPNDFQKVETPIEMPEVATFETIAYDPLAYYPDPIEYQKIWSAVHTIAVLKEYRTSNPNAKISVLLYTPSIGVLDPTAADWILVIKN